MLASASRNPPRIIGAFVIPEDGDHPGCSSFIFWFIDISCERSVGGKLSRSFCYKSGLRFPGRSDIPIASLDGAQPAKPFGKINPNLEHRTVNTLRFGGSARATPCQPCDIACHAIGRRARPHPDVFRRRATQQELRMISRLGWPRAAPSIFRAVSITNDASGKRSTSKKSSLCRWLIKTSCHSVP
jgi:hypothetical protein